MCAILFRKNGTPRAGPPNHTVPLNLYHINTHTHMIYFLSLLFIVADFIRPICLPDIIEDISDNLNNREDFYYVVGWGWTVGCEIRNLSSYMRTTFKIIFEFQLWEVQATLNNMRASNWCTTKFVKSNTIKSNWIRWAVACECIRYLETWIMLSHLEFSNLRRRKRRN